MTPLALLAHSGIGAWLVLFAAPLMAVGVWEWIERRSARPDDRP